MHQIFPELQVEGHTLAKKRERETKGERNEARTEFNKLRLSSP